MTTSTRLTDPGFCQQVVLRNGTPVTIRVMRPDDKGRLVEAFAKLDPQSIYVRFFSFRKELRRRPAQPNRPGRLRAPARAGGDDRVRK